MDTMQTMLVLLLLLLLNGLLVLLLLLLNGTFQILLLLVGGIPPLGRRLLQLLLLLLLLRRRCCLLLLLVPLRCGRCRHHVGHAEPVVVGCVVGRGRRRPGRTATASAAAAVRVVAGRRGRDLETTRHLVREDLLTVGLAGGRGRLLLLEERLLLQLLVVHLLLLVLLVQQALVHLGVCRGRTRPPYGATVLSARSCASPRTTRAMVLRHDCWVGWLS